jgi:hypothetical protein
MIEFVFAGVLLPAYPIENIKTEDTPIQILNASNIEYQNPHNCIKIIDNYLTTEYNHTISLANVPDETQDGTSENISDKNLDAFKHFSYNEILANITKYSCLISSDQIEEAEDLASKISSSNIKKHPKLNFVFKYNLNRQILLNAESNSKFEFTNLDPLANFSKDAKLNKLNKQYISILNLNKNILKENFIDSTITLNTISNNLEIDKLPIDLRANLLYNSYILLTIANKSTLALNILEETISTTNTPKYSYLNNIYTNVTAIIFAKYNLYNKAIQYQQKYLKAFEKQPEEFLKYLYGIVNLAEFYQYNLNQDLAYTYAIKAHNLLETFSEKTKHLFDLRLRVASIIGKLNSNNSAENIIKKYYLYFKNNANNENIFKIGLIYLDTLIKNNDLYKAKKLLDELTKLQNSITFSIKYNHEFYLVKAHYYEKLNKYKTAYENLEHAIKIQDSLHNKIPKIITEQEDLKKIAIEELKTHNNLMQKFSKIFNEDAEFISAAHYSLLLFVLLLLLIIFRINHKYKTLLMNSEQLEDNEKYLKSTELPTLNEFLNKMRDISTVLNNQNSKNITKILPEKNIFHIYLPGLTNLNLNIGNTHANFTYNIFKSKLKDSIELKNGLLYEIAPDRYIIIFEQNADHTVKDKCQENFELIQEFLKELHVHSRICIGVIDYPFINNHLINLDISKIFELSQIALQGALNINNSENTWLKISAMTKNKDFMTKGEIRHNVLDGIRKKHLRIISSDNESIDWEKLLDNIS